MRAFRLNNTGATMMMNGPGVVVGFDGSASSARALDWAATEATMRHVPLTVCHAWDVPVPSADPAAAGGVQRAAEQVLARGVALAGRCGPGPDVALRLLRGPAAAELVHASAGAELLVAGTRGTASWNWPGLGSVSNQLAAVASCPLLLIPDDGAWRDGPIVVGVDGSPWSQNAAGFAFGEAHLRHVPVLAAWWSQDPGQVELITRPWREKYPEVAFSASSATPAPAAALRALAETAPLLVVGSRSADDIPGPPLGPVAREVLQNAAHPIAVVR
jgi:nucleotide-binding universal stress UspA family protein